MIQRPPPGANLTGALRRERHFPGAKVRSIPDPASFGRCRMFDLFRAQWISIWLMKFPGPISFPSFPL